ncbi:MAG: putative oxidoreductase [Aureispira sp.]|jgi:putative oxidoreductase
MNEKVVLGIRILLGLGLVMFGSNKFLGFMETPALSAAAGEFMGAMFKTGYILPIAGAVQILAGISFLTNKFVPLMAVVLFPVMLNAFLFHAVLDPSGVGGAAVVMTLNVVLMFANKPAYEKILKP